MGKRHPVIEGCGGIAILCSDAGFCPCAEFELLSATCVLTVDDASNKNTTCAVDSNIGPTFPLINAEITRVCSVTEIPFPFVSVLPHIVGSIDIGQTTATIQPNLTQFTRNGHVDVEGISGPQLIPTNPGSEVISAGFFVLIYWNCNGVKNITGQYRFGVFGHFGGFWCIAGTD